MMSFSLFTSSEGEILLESPQKSFESDRLIFRLLQNDDADLLFPYITEKITHYWIGWEYPKNKEECSMWIATLLKRNGIQLLAFCKETNDLVGGIGIDFVDRTEEYELDVWVSTSMQNKGYATEMLKSFLFWLQGHTKLEYILYSYTQGNSASRHLLKKIPHIFLRRK